MTKKPILSKGFRDFGTPSEKQRLFFDSRAKYTAYGGARGGGKSWALRRKLALMALRWPGSKLLLVRRSYPELYSNHILPLQAALRGVAVWNEQRKCFRFKNGSILFMGYLANDSDAQRYQGREYDVIAIDEATQITEYQFNCLRACLRGVSRTPKRMYLSCNPGGIGHIWVKRLFVDRNFVDGENPDDYAFIQAKAADNPALLKADPDYVNRLRAIRDPRLRRAWLDGDWNVFEGQFFAEFDPERHVKYQPALAGSWFCGLDYGFDMLALIVCVIGADGHVHVAAELCRENLTLSAAAIEIRRKLDEMRARYPKSEPMYIAASPDLWNRRQDSGVSGIETMSRIALPPLIRADDRRVPGWLNMREYLAFSPDGAPGLTIDPSCETLISSMQALVFSKTVPDDASDRPHSATHAPEALRYALMSRPRAPVEAEKTNFAFERKNPGGWNFIR